MPSTYSLTVLGLENQRKRCTFSTFYMVITFAQGQHLRQNETRNKEHFERAGTEVL